MGSRRGRLNWSNLDVHISDETVDNQHRFHRPLSVAPTWTENTTVETQEPVQPPPATKRAWVPKKEAGEIQVEQFVGNYMLTTAEEKSMEKKYKNPMRMIEPTAISPIPNSIRFSNRLASTPIPNIAPSAPCLFAGQHLLDVFVCHVESYSRIYIMFGDSYTRATKLFDEMNQCNELNQSVEPVFQPKEKDWVAINHEKKWFRGQCLQWIGNDVNVLCVDSGAIITCSPKDLRRLPERTSPPCCIECSLSGLPSTIAMNSIPDSVQAQCYELLYKDRYEAIVTRLETTTRPTIVLFYGDININDRLLSLLQLI